MVAIRLGLLVVGIAACGGTEGPAERMCQAANDCGALGSDDVGACVETLEQFDAERALTECADCLETVTCADLNGGECTDHCAPFASAFTGSSGINPVKLPADLTDEELAQFCEWAVDRQGGPGREVTCGDVVIVTQTVAECATWLRQATCQRTMGDYEACFAAIDSENLCEPVPACEAIAAC